MEKLLTLLVVSSLSVASIDAQTVSDDFNDNSRVAAIWAAPIVEAGADGKLDERNGRLELSASSAVENFVLQPARIAPTYDQAWQASAVVALDPSNCGGRPKSESKMTV